MENWSRLYAGGRLKIKPALSGNTYLTVPLCKSALLQFKLLWNIHIQSQAPVDDQE